MTAGPAGGTLVGMKLLALVVLLGSSGCAPALVRAVADDGPRQHVAEPEPTPAEKRAAREAKRPKEMVCERKGSRQVCRER